MTNPLLNKKNIVSTHAQLLEQIPLLFMEFVLSPVLAIIYQPCIFNYKIVSRERNTVKPCEHQMTQVCLILKASLLAHNARPLFDKCPVSH